MISSRELEHETAPTVALLEFDQGSGICLDHADLSSRIAQEKRLIQIGIMGRAIRSAPESAYYFQPKLRGTTNG